MGDLNEMDTHIMPINHNLERPIVLVCMLRQAYRKPKFPKDVYGLKRVTTSIVSHENKASTNRSKSTVVQRWRQRSVKEDKGRTS